MTHSHATSGMLNGKDPLNSSWTREQVEYFFKTSAVSKYLLTSMLTCQLQERDFPTGTSWLEISTNAVEGCNHQLKNLLRQMGNLCKKRDMGAHDFVSLVDKLLNSLEMRVKLTLNGQLEEWGGLSDKRFQTHHVRLGMGQHAIEKTFHDECVEVMKQQLEVVKAKKAAHVEIEDVSDVELEPPSSDVASCTDLTPLPSLGTSSGKWDIKALSMFLQREFRLSTAQLSKSATLAKWYIHNMHAVVNHVQSKMHMPRPNGKWTLQFTSQDDTEQVQEHTITMCIEQVHCTCMGKRPKVISNSVKHWCAHELFIVVNENLDLEELLKHKPKETAKERKEREALEKRSKRAAEGFHPIRHLLNQYQPFVTLHWMVTLIL